MADQHITLDPSAKRFAQGVTAGAKVREAHAAITFPTPIARVSLFWFYVGALAVDEHGCTEQEDFEPFILGAATRQPDLT